jgi:hypothetical protein
MRGVVTELVVGSLARAGAGRVLNSLCEAEAEIPLPHPERSCEWLNGAILEGARCHEIVERGSPGPLTRSDLHPGPDR